jgi:hypothetical protein
LFAITKVLTVITDRGWIGTKTDAELHIKLVVIETMKLGRAVPDAVPPRQEYNMADCRLNTR